MQEDKWEVQSKYNRIAKTIEDFVAEVATAFNDNMRFDDEFEALIKTGGVINLTFNKDKMGVTIKHKEVDSAKPNDDCRAHAGLTV